MTTAVERLTRLVDSDDRYNIPYSELLQTQIEAMNERFQQRKESIKLLGHRAKQAGITEVGSREEMVQLLFPHTAYKSYPENFLVEEKWDKLGKWLDTVSTHRVPTLDASKIGDIDDWVNQLQELGFFVSCSSGTTGKSAMLVASRADMEWCQKETVCAYAWGSGIKPAQDRRMFSLAPVAHVPRNIFTARGQEAAYSRPDKPRFDYPVPPITVGQLTRMVVLRKKIADGTATPGDLTAFESISAERQRAVEAAVGITARALVEARADKIHIGGLWAGVYEVAKAVRELGYSAKDFHPENSIYVGGGLKRAVLPPDYREFVYETFNIAPDRNFQNYSMQELHTGMPRCQKGGRYHLPAWLVPLMLNKEGDALLPETEGQVEGRAAFFDLSIDGRWGGVISGDKITIDFSPCACGAKGPSIQDNVMRYADLEGEDKIGCAGTVDAYVRGVV
jgi:hypothetical protein